MKTLILKISSFICVILLLSTAITSSSCNKDKTCHGTVHVHDTTGAGIYNATVKLGAPSVNGDVTYTDVTDASGDVTFEVKLPAIFDVTATKSTLPGKTGVGILRLDEPGKTGEVTVTMR